MKFTKRIQIMLLVSLIALNIILRMPTTPHEIGIDSFEIHVLANSVSAFGEAKWWAHPLSIAGFYPLSYASAVPFVLSGISQSTGMPMERTIMLFSMFIGLFSAFSAYLLAGVLWDNDFFKFLVALTFSTSQGILTFSTWTATTRGFFIVVLPLFIYLLLKNRTSLSKYSAIAVILFALLIVTHNLIYFVFPIILSYFIVVVFYKLGKYINTLIIPESFVNIALLASFLVMFAMPFFTHTLWIVNPETVGAGVSSRYMVLFSMIETYVRYIGVLIIFSVSGYVYILLKRNKRFEEWVLLLTLVCLAPFLYVSTYMKWFILIFAFLLIGIGLTNVASVASAERQMKPHMTGKKRKTYIASFIVLLLILSVCFSGFYQFIHFSIEPPSYGRHMGESTYISGSWIRDNINKNLFYNDHLVALRSFAISGVPTVFGGAVGQAYSFEKIEDLDITENSPLSTEYYEHGPYIKTWGTPDTRWMCEILMNSKIGSYYGELYVSKFNISYVLEAEKRRYGTFIRSVTPNTDKIYSNGKIQIWYL